jgi:hypothetical protein
MSLPRFHLKIRHFYDIQIIILNGETGLLSHEMVTRPNSSSSAPRGIFYLPKIFLFLALLVIKMLKLVNVSPGCCCRQEETKIGKRKFHSYITITRSKSFFLFFSRWNGHKICRLGIQIDKMRSFAFVVCWYTTKATGVFSLFFFCLWKLGASPAGACEHGKRGSERARTQPLDCGLGRNQEEEEEDPFFT